MGWGCESQQPPLAGVTHRLLIKLDYLSARWVPMTGPPPAQKTLFIGPGHQTCHLAEGDNPSHRREPSLCGEAVPSSRRAAVQTLSALFTLAWVAGTGGALQGAARGPASRPTWRPKRTPGQRLYGAGGGVHGGASSPAATGPGAAAHRALLPKFYGPLSCPAGENSHQPRPTGRNNSSKDSESLPQRKQGGWTRGGGTPSLWHPGLAWMPPGPRDPLPAPKDTHVASLKRASKPPHLSQSL